MRPSYISSEGRRWYSSNRWMWPFIVVAPQPLRCPIYEPLAYILGSVAPSESLYEKAISGFHCHCGLTDEGGKS